MAVVRPREKRSETKQQGSPTCDSGSIAALTGLDCAAGGAVRPTPEPGSAAASPSFCADVLLRDSLVEGFLPASAVALLAGEELRFPAAASPVAQVSKGPHVYDSSAPSSHTKLTLGGGAPKPPEVHASGPRKGSRGGARASPWTEGERERERQRERQVLLTVAVGQRGRPRSAPAGGCGDDDDFSDARV